MNFKRKQLVPGVVVLFFALTLGQRANPASAAQIDIAGAANTVCAVMAGTQKADPHSLQLVLLVEGQDYSDADPVSLALTQRVLHQCPRAYLAFQQRERSGNPFAAHPLVGGQQQLTGGGTSLTQPPVAAKDYALFCRGGRGVATTSGATLILRFERGATPGSVGPGQCSWADRPVSASEPVRVTALLKSAGQAHNGATQIDAGGSWTFFAHNANGALVTSAITKGFTTTRP